MSRKSEILYDITKMNKEQIEMMCYYLLLSGDWYMEDKRKKREFCMQVVVNNYHEKPEQYYQKDSVEQIEEAYKQAISVINR